MLTIIVGPGRERIQTVDGNKMIVLRAQATVGGRLRPLRNICSFKNVQDVQIVVKTRKEETPIELTKPIRNAIVSFLNLYHGQSNLKFDCYEFANTVHKLPVHRSSEMLRFWDIDNADELRPGGVIFYLNPDAGVFYHAAVYLGGEVFVSAYGAGGDLEFSTLEDMQRDFGAPDVTIAVPKTQTTV